MTIIYFILWCLFAIFDGVRDGFMYHVKKIDNENPINEHIIFSVHRFFPLVMVGIFDWLLLIPAILSFPFFHDGAYYLTRDKLSPGLYPKKWLDHSTTSTAKLTKFLDAETRLILLTLGFYIFVYVYKFNTL